MKKTKLIAITLVIAVMAMGAGYAAWTDQLTIKNTVNTGSLNVVFEDAFGLNKQIEDYDNDPTNGKPFKTGDFDYVNIGLPGNMPQTELSEDKHTITFYNENFYPGAGAWLKFKILNEGTVAAKVQGISGVVKQGENIKDEFIYTISKVTLHKKDGSTQQLYSGNLQCNSFDEFVTKLSTRLSINPSTNQPIILEPGDWLVLNGADDDLAAESIGYDIFMKNSAPNGSTEGETLKFNLNLVYTQFNSNPQ